MLGVSSGLISAAMGGIGAVSASAIATAAFSNLKHKYVSRGTAAKLCYCLIAADGIITEDEKAGFREIAESFGCESDDEWSGAAREIEEIYKSGNLKTISSQIEEYASYILSAPGRGQGQINPYLLIWNMMTLAICDQDFAPSEKQLINTVAEGLGIAQGVVMAMDEKLNTLYALQAEEQKLKQAEKSFKNVEVMQQELEQKKDDILANVTLFIDKIYKSEDDQLKKSQLLGDFCQAK